MKMKNTVFRFKSESKCDSLSGTDALSPISLTHSHDKIANFFGIWPDCAMGILDLFGLGSFLCIFLGLGTKYFWLVTAPLFLSRLTSTVVTFFAYFYVKPVENDLETEYSLIKRSLREVEERSTKDPDDHFKLNQIEQSLAEQRLPILKDSRQIYEKLHAKIQFLSICVATFTVVSALLLASITISFHRSINAIDGKTQLYDLYMGSSFVSYPSTIVNNTVVQKICDIVFICVAFMLTPFVSYFYSYFQLLPTQNFFEFEKLEILRLSIFGHFVDSWGCLVLLIISRITSSTTSMFCHRILWAFPYFYTLVSGVRMGWSLYMYCISESSEKYFEDVLDSNTMEVFRRICHVVLFIGATTMIVLRFVNIGNSKMYPFYFIISTIVGRFVNMIVNLSVA